MDFFSLCLAKLSGEGCQEDNCIDTCPSAEARRSTPLSFCGLYLAPNEFTRGRERILSGIVTGHELSTLSLEGCELVVISTCDSHAGIRRESQGVESLQKAFLMAGARTVITSLWRVEDEAARDFMFKFYELVWKGKLSKAEALWKAKMYMQSLTMNPNSSKPRYSYKDWAGWVLAGDPN